ncbi:MAG TPA: ferrous iron transport protein B [Syntrophorhabdaceae bacterium]|nr:ferrous iron transport protein B [Syntrophorhabdaceae bacterium]
MSSNLIKVALIGNPNVGKTSVFNELTGLNQQVGNYPGITVEKKQGVCKLSESVKAKIIDLPGTYSLTAYSAEELVARNFIVDEKPDVVVDIIDSSNLERNLYLTVQLMETGAPLVLAFNMSDEARTRGYEFDLERFSRFFNAPVVRTVGHKGEGMDELMKQIVTVALQEKEPRDTPSVNYGEELEEEIGKMIRLLDEEPLLAEKYGARWLSVKLLENDRDVLKKVSSDAVRAQLAKSSSHVEGILGEGPETIIASSRYGFISGACQEAVHSTVEVLHTISDRIDTVITNRVLGIPIFLGLMYLVFYLTFTLGDPPMGWIEGLFGWLGGKIGALWPEGSESLLRSLIVDGIIGGVGGVIVFLPNILLLFFAIAILEDSGYMARAAFIMDKLMHRIGLHGKSFIPMLIGFGCSVPAIMATRMLENRRDRLVTMLVVPLMSCGARLPIYALIIPAFFPQAWNAPMLWIIYVIGILLAVLSAKALRSTIFKGESVPFVMELPPYRLPTLRGVLTHMWQRGWLYLKKAGTVILGISILLWALTAFPGLPQEQAERFEKEKQTVEATVTDEEKKKEKIISIENMMREASLKGSIAGRIGHALEPVLKPMGFDWKIGTALIGAFAAKEVFVAQLGIVYSVGKEANEESSELRDQLRANYTPLVAFCIMLFCLVSAPCMATIAVTRRESNSWKWALFQLAGLTVMAWILTVIVFQAGRLLGIGI